jgi:hypothetical protein
MTLPEFWDLPALMDSSEEEYSSDEEAQDQEPSSPSPRRTFTSDEVIELACFFEECLNLHASGDHGPHFTMSGILPADQAELGVAACLSRLSPYHAYNVCDNR